MEVEVYVEVKVKVEVKVEVEVEVEVEAKLEPYLAGSSSSNTKPILVKFLVVHLMAIPDFDRFLNKNFKDLQKAYLKM